MVFLSRTLSGDNITEDDNERNKKKNNTQQKSIL